ncbi:MAG: hypothetical protein RSE26_01765 [Malacoplasma sp.]
MINNDSNKDLKYGSENTPWYKKKSSIIAMSSTLGVGALATVIAVPVALTSNNTTDTNTGIVTSVNVKNVYDLTNKSVRLIISGTYEGKNLPTELTSYKIFSDSSRNAKASIQNITLTIIAKQIHLKFNDQSLTASTKYQVAINDSKPISVKESFAQPVINIGTQPSNKIASDTSQVVTLSVNATIANPIGEQTTPNYQWYMSDTNDANNATSWELINGARSSEYPYDATNLTTSTKKYFRCLISYQYTDIMASNVVSVEKQTTSTGPTTEQIAAAVTTFNAKTKDEKLKLYNDIMANTSNNTKIKDYIMKQGGMGKFFTTNATAPTNGNDLASFNFFKAFLTTYNTSIISSTNPIFTPTNGEPFMNIKGVKEGSNNMNTTSTYVTHDLSAITNSAFSSYSFYSPTSASISDITMSNDFSISMTLTTSDVSNNFIFKIISIATNKKEWDINYKSTITFNNSTLFPGMSEYVKTNILSLKA